MNSGHTQLRPVGTHALLIDLPDLESVMRWHAALSATPTAGQTGVVAAARTVLVEFATASSARRAVPELEAFSAPETTPSDGREVTVDVVYDGEDLDALAGELDMSTAALTDWHTGTSWVAAFGGFAPGFTYCVPQDAGSALSVPRLESPRTAVPPGAVGLAGEFSAVYPRTSPGGWRLVGSTSTAFWDTEATPPALLSPGDRIRYRAVRERVEVSGGPGALSPTGKRRPALRVDDPGLQTLVEDIGRPGHGDRGVTSSGAADRASAAAANDALGNTPDAAVLENIGGLSLTALVDCVLVVTGADAPTHLGSRTVRRGVPTLVSAGSTLTVGDAVSGLRSYVGVRGGVVTGGVLGSSSADTLSGLGPAPLADGDVVHAGEPQGSVGPSSFPGTAPATTLRIVPGPRDDWFDGGVSALTDHEWQVSAQSDRIGLRLETAGPADPADSAESHITRATTDELPSEGMVAGSVQVPPDGNPVVFLRDHAVTGGYPVIATVVAEDLDAAAQLPPGARITFKEYA